MCLPPFPFTVLDTETTGFVPRVHHVMEFACVRCDGGKVVDTYEVLLSVEGEIPPHVQVLTRIRPEAIKDQPNFAAKTEEIKTHIGEGTLLVGQNLQYDIGMIRGEGLDLTDREMIDTSMLASLVYPEFASYSLGYMSAVLKLNHEPEHRALGDVRATLELLSLVWERLLEMNETELQFARETFKKVGGGYMRLFDALPDTSGKGASWIAPMKNSAIAADGSDEKIGTPLENTVDMVEENLDPAFLQRIINVSAKKKEPTWIAVKNLDAQLRRLSLPTGAIAIHPRQLLLDQSSASALQEQSTLSVEEALLCLKLKWFNPRTREELPLHGGEKEIWNGRLACTESSPAYAEQFSTNASVRIIDHRQFLTILRSPSHPAHKTLTADAHIIIDDASMLEDTATKAFGHYLNADDLRAAANGNKELTSLTDLLMIWLERTRKGEDAHHITRSELDSAETAGLRSQITTILESNLPAKTHEMLTELQSLIAPTILPESMLWIECRMDKTLSMHSALPAVDLMLDEVLYKKYKTTLLVPRGYTQVLPEIVPQRRAVRSIKHDIAPHTVHVSFPEETSLQTMLKNPPTGKSIVLCGSKRVIEEIYITNAERIEDSGATLICQGLAGGQGRMESEFLAATGTVIWVLTPWMYEGIELPLGTTDRLFIESLPFDHPNQPVFTRRKDRHRNGFEDYALPRVECRLFRLLRTFCKQRKVDGDVVVLDRRLREKGYGKRIMAYLSQFEGVTKTVSATEKTVDQMKLF